MRQKYLTLIFCLASPSLFADWTNWRGPNFNLSTEDQAFPSQFSDSDNVVLVRPHTRPRNLYPGHLGRYPVRDLLL